MCRRIAERLAWLTGFTGSAGTAVVLADKAAIFVDGRYTLQARDQVDTAVFTPVAVDRDVAGGVAEGESHARASASATTLARDQPQVRKRFEKAAGEGRRGRSSPVDGEPDRRGLGRPSAAAARAGHSRMIRRLRRRGRGAKLKRVRQALLRRSGAMRGRLRPCTRLPGSSTSAAATCRTRRSRSPSPRPRRRPSPTLFIDGAQAVERVRDTLERLSADVRAARRFRSAAHAEIGERRDGARSTIDEGVGGGRSRGSSKKPAATIVDVGADPVALPEGAQERGRARRRAARRTSATAPR